MWCHFVNIKKLIKLEEKHLFLICLLFLFRVFVVIQNVGCLIDSSRGEGIDVVQCGGVVIIGRIGARKWSFGLLF